MQIRSKSIRDFSPNEFDPNSQFKSIQFLVDLNQFSIQWIRDWNDRIENLVSDFFGNWFRNALDSLGLNCFSKLSPGWLILKIFKYENGYRNKEAKTSWLALGKCQSIGEIHILPSILTFYSGLFPQNEVLHDGMWHAIKALKGILATAFIIEFN